jgi:hypothetical protein
MGDFPILEAFLGFCGLRGSPTHVQWLLPSFSLLTFGFPWLMLLAALMCSSVGGAMHGPSPMVSWATPPLVLG